ncbi:hypothetical protein BJX70DRAFT_402315 [Aspergillus crustosus]
MLGLAIALGIGSLSDQWFTRPCTRSQGHASLLCPSVWLWLKDMSSDAPQANSELHKELGPIVRTSPNKVSINDFEIHNRPVPPGSQAAYFYGPFKTGPSSIFQSSEPREHSSILRRLVSKPFPGSES